MFKKRTASLNTSGFVKGRSRLLTRDQLFPRMPLRIMRVKKKRSKRLRIRDQKKRKKLKIMDHSILMNSRKSNNNQNLLHSVEGIKYKEALREK